MKNLKLIWLLLALLSFTIVSCDDDDEPDEIIIDSSLPTGTFTASRSGSLTAQNGTPTSGSVDLGTDEDGVTYLHFGSNFTTELGTGTVTIYLSTSDTFMADPANGNPDLILVGVVDENGESYFKISKTVSSSFTHVIIWCGSANIPFGNAQLQ
ncbi:MAG: hypothetical protein CMO01_25145 [Thalassobius sp.]|nr:hypothetical protein [Thalassovita sp.]